MLILQGQQFRLPPLRTHTLDSDSETEDERRRESTAARLRRLKAELAEVEAEIKAGPSSSASATATAGGVGGKRRSVFPPKPAFDIASEMSGLRERLSNLEGVEIPEDGGVGEDDEWSARLERLKLVGERSGKSDEVLDGDDAKSKGTGTFAVSELDKRLARLENALGTDETTASSADYLVGQSGPKLMIGRHP
jgi:nuclear migration protein JNM1